MAYKELSHRDARRRMTAAGAGENTGSSAIPRWVHENWVKEVLAAKATVFGSYHEGPPPGMTTPRTNEPDAE
jgi:hypothetical protein